MKKIAFISACLFAFSMLAQRSKVQSVWRSLSDYEDLLKEGRPDPALLKKASDAIDQALTNEESKKMPRAHAYKMRISYAKYRESLAGEMKKLESDSLEKGDIAMQAYGNTPVTEMEAAVDALNNVRDLDPKYIGRIQQGLLRGGSSLDEEELKFAQSAQQMKLEISNIASGKFTAKKYGVAADYYYRSAVINTILYAATDSVSFYNACVAASKAKDANRMLEYNQRMIDAKIAVPYNYESLYHGAIDKGDSAKAVQALRKGREAFPDDAGLLTQETNLFLTTGKHQEALKNLEISLQKDPGNAVYYFFTGNIYDNMANPKENSGAEAPKPSNFEELFRKAETNYLKAIELRAANSDYVYYANFNLGAMYNNYGGYLASRKIEKITDAAKYQKENEARAQVYYKKAIPYLETALETRPDDRVTMTALRKLYLLTGNDVKAKEMSEKLKG